MGRRRKVVIFIFPYIFECVDLRGGGAPIFGIKYENFLIKIIGKPIKVVGTPYIRQVLVEASVVSQSSQSKLLLRESAIWFFFWKPIQRS